ncbi:SRPBCC family protein [Cellulomonas edaphi]|uniref:SRPBCC family protein n=1 Tax=Cellulomonas edaphi TaxID=3053468 RepID=A0ABT7S4W0_9CELL|nr:SRPBCC family protein [Cellulomons edaphi]MDM7830666.1 SRPBCC family protein [Cellulomons edaphi]
MTTLTDRFTQHATFVVERTYPVPVERVWAAHADNAQRVQWFGAEDSFVATEDTQDFRVGGRTVNDGRWHDGPTSRYVSTYTDIVENRRIVNTYDMWVDGEHLSTSIATTELEPVDGGTRLTYTEQGVYFDVLDHAPQREQGCAGILDALGAFLTR